MADNGESLRQANALLQQQLAHARLELQDFTYSVSHDLRASLRHVTAYLQIIREDAQDMLTGANRDHLNTVEQAARHMERLIDGLMALSKLGQISVQPITLEVGPLVHELRRAWTLENPAREVQWEIAGDFPWLLADPQLVRQLLGHLLDNALKFTRSRSQPCISVSWRAGAPGWCALVIADNGVGFNPRYGPKLFHALTRLHSASSYPGMGMGLALVRKITELHGGSVQAHSDGETGCSITVNLPLAR